MALDVMSRPHQLIASDRVEGTAVRRPNGDMIGHIERLMIDKVSGKVSYAVLSFGGFLGMGTNLLPLPWGRLRYNTKFEAYELDIEKDELEHAPSFRADKDFDWRSRAGSGITSLLRHATLLGRFLSMFPASSAGTLADVTGFLSTDFCKRENLYVSQVYRRRPRGFRAAGKRRVCAIADRDVGQHQDGARCRVRHFVAVPRSLACLEGGRLECLQ